MGGLAFLRSRPVLLTVSLVDLNTAARSRSGILTPSISGRLSRYGAAAPQVQPPVIQHERWVIVRGLGDQRRDE